MRRALWIAPIFLLILHSVTQSAQSSQKEESSAGDFVELQRTRGMCSCPEYTVRIYDDGRVLWKGNLQVQVTGPATSSIPQAQAHALIQKFIDDGFWNLSGGVPGRGNEGGTAVTVLHVGSKQKSHANYRDDLSTKLQALENAVDAAANTHQWIHGDPRKEPLSNISSEVVASKPGVTPLMRAAFLADTVETQRLVAMQSPLNAQDSSGWTALYYAAQSAKPDGVNSKTRSPAIDPVKLLLDSGADPNIRSTMDQTALMAAVIPYFFPVERVKLLISAGANVNAQDRNGQTALMHLIRVSLASRNSDSYAPQLELCSVLRAAGARTDLRDSAGLTVFDHLDQQLQHLKDREMRLQIEKLRTALQK